MRRLRGRGGDKRGVRAAFKPLFARPSASARAALVRGSRRVLAAKRSREEAAPSGRPMFPPPECRDRLIGDRRVEKVSEAAPRRSISGATLTSLSSRPSRCALTGAQRTFRGVTAGPRRISTTRHREERSDVAIQGIIGLRRRS